MNRAFLSRREALGGLVFVAGLAGAAPALAAPAAALAPLTWTPAALTPTQARTLDALAELIMPATDTPGARAAGAPAFVDRAVATWSAPAEAELIRAGLDRLDADARAAHGLAFAALTLEHQAALVSAWAAQAVAGRPHAFPLLRELVSVGFYTSEPGATQTLRYDPVPGDYRGCVPAAEIGRAWAT